MTGRLRNGRDGAGGLREDASAQREPFLTRRQWLGGGLALTSLGLLAGCGLSALPFAQPAHVPLLGWLSPVNGPGSRELEALRQGLRELGYIEDRTVRVETRVADGDNQRLPVLAAELVALGVDVLVTDGPPAAAAAKNATRTIPIVMGVVAEPVAAGLVESLGRPGGNITGFTALVPGIFGKRLQLFKEAVPDLVRLAALYDPTTPITAVTDTQAAAPALRLEMEIFTIRGVDELESALEAASAAHFDGLVAIGGPLQASARGRIVQFAAEHRLPGSYPDRDYALAGGLMSYGPNIPDILRRSASYVDKVLKGANAGDLPIQQPTSFDLVVNLKAAQALGIAVAPAVLAQATEVVQSRD